MGGRGRRGQRDRGRWGGETEKLVDRLDSFFSLYMCDLPERSRCDRWSVDRVCCWRSQAPPAVHRTPGATSLQMQIFRGTCSAQGKWRSCAAGRRHEARIRDGGSAPIGPCTDFAFAHRFQWSDTRKKRPRASSSLHHRRVCTENALPSLPLHHIKPRPAGLLLGPVLWQLRVRTAVCEARAAPGEAWRGRRGIPKRAEQASCHEVRMKSERVLLS